MKILFISFLIVLSAKSFADFDHSINFSIGIYNSSLTENDSKITQTDTTVQDNSAVTLNTSEVSVISSLLSYEHVMSSEYTLIVDTLFPLVSADGTGAYALNVGGNWYVNGMSSRYKIVLNNNELKLTPKFRYYIGGSAGLAYTVYTTPSAKKQDVLFNLTARGGGYYSISDDYSIKGEVSIGRGSGVITTSINIGVLFGVTMYI